MIEVTCDKDLEDEVLGAHNNVFGREVLQVREEECVTVCSQQDFISRKFKLRNRIFFTSFYEYAV